MRLSIRWRLTLWNTLALAVVLLIFAAMVYGLVRHALYEQVDHKLETAWQQLRQDDRLKTDAVFWKREVGDIGSRWVEPTESDYADHDRWG